MKKWEQHHKDECLKLIEPYLEKFSAENMVKLMDTYNEYRNVNRLEQLVKPCRCEMCVLVAHLICLLKFGMQDRRLLMKQIFWDDFNYSIKFSPPDDLKGRDDWSPATNPFLNCPVHIVSSGSSWFCTNCGTVGYCQYEHGIEDMIEFIKQHKNCGF